jgi:hypothetical protein
MDWKFTDPPNLAVFTTQSILEGDDWISFVTHDSDDGGWQFIGTAVVREQDARIVGLGEIVDLDPSIEELFDLPLGWRASRSSRTGSWRFEGPAN